MIAISSIQNEIAQQALDGWLFYDFRRNNPLAIHFLGIEDSALLTRRFFYWIPVEGQPVKIVSKVENPLTDLPGIEMAVGSWNELQDVLHKLLKGKAKVAMEYSPNGRIPEVSRVDAGTVDLIRSFGCEVVSSGNLLQALTSKLSHEAFESHLQAASALDAIAALTWKYIASSYVQGISEWDVQQFMFLEMKKREMKTDHPPICAVNAHAADPHFSPKKGGNKIVPGDFILIDLWCKKKAPGAIYADITRVGVLGRATARQAEIFEIVKRAQNACVAFIKDRYQRGIPVKGCEADAVCREVIEEAGYGQFFVHRTGHNIHEADHGPGAHLDSLETFDERVLMPETCFSVEPGIYLPNEFGVRLEFDLFLHPNGEVLITGGRQEKLEEIPIG